MTENKMPVKEFLPLLGVTCAAFIFNTSEFMPIGLLTDIAADFGMTEAAAGRLISVYAWVVMILSLPLMLLVCRMELKKLMLTTIGVFSASQLLSAVSTGFWGLMAARVGVACAHAVFWSIASPMAVRLVAEKFRSKALGMIVAGTSIAMILGLPFGRMIGLLIGWRMTFLGVGVFGFATMAYLFFTAPKLEGGEGFSVKKLPALFENAALSGIFALTLAVSCAYYTAYSFIEPFLLQTAKLPDGWVTAALSVFGASGLIGSKLFSKYYDKAPLPFLNLTVFGMAGALLALYPASFGLPSIVVLFVFWGTAATAFNVSCQAEIIKRTDESASAVAMSIFSGIFNMGIALGTMFGGTICTKLSIADIGFGGAVIALPAFLTCACIVRRKARQPA